jgi:hypothetical protein
MTRALWQNGRRWLPSGALLGAVLGALAMSGCGTDDGKTAACPDIPLYDVHDASQTDIDNRTTAAAKGCVTTAGDASTGLAGGGGLGGGAGSGGTTASGGTGGTGGAAGGTQDAGDAATD